jgi:hypothetical protein
MSEQAARTTEAMTEAAMRRRRRIIGLSPDGKLEGVATVLELNTCATYDHQEMSKWRFLIRKCLFPIRNSTFSITYPSR